MRQNVFQWSCLLLICAVFPLVTHSSNSCGVTFVLFGSTGSLAHLYLWPALFKWHLSSQPRDCELIIFGASRQPFTDEEGSWREITSNVNCNTDFENCDEAISRFRKATFFIQIRSHDHYKILQRQIQELYLDKGLKEVGRVFYLSIPPSGYEEVSQNIHHYLRPEAAGTWLRVVLEKPFGNDLASAKLLASEISSYLSDEEIYRVDHYLGKFGVEQILPFRLENDDFLSPLWNKDAVQFVEVGMKERLDVKGRSKFYDSYGVIRDVLQNHLTEILVRLLVPTRVFDNSKQFTREKKKVLSKLYPPTFKHSLLGQYMDYHEHLKEDGVVLDLVDGNSSRSLTPTYASVALYLRDPQWRGVPFILISGKQLDQRTAYARVVFKQRQFHMGAAASNNSLCLPEIIFLIQDEQFTSPGILISEQLSSIEFTHPSNMESVSWKHDITTYPRGSGSNCQYTYLHPSLDVEANSYISLTKAVLEGKHEHFVDTDSLLLAWEVWTPLLHEIEVSKHFLNLHSYSNDMLDGLNFQLKGTNMLPMNSILSVNGVDHKTNVAVVDAKYNLSSVWTGLLGHRSIVTHKHALSTLIAEDILQAAQTSVKLRGEFHLALPGGQSPVLLLNQLSLDYSTLFPWQQTHVWQTDERCVKATSSDSNWKQISEYLLSVVPIPFHHLHAMPTQLQNGICSNDDKGDILYHRALNESLLENKLDYIVLGVGADGHIASLFPQAATSETSTSDDLVMITELKQSHSIRIKKRMTLTLETILNARTISVILTGVEKRGLLDKVAECLLEVKEPCDFPLVMLLRAASLTQLSLFIDSEL